MNQIVTILSSYPPPYSAADAHARLDAICKPQAVDSIHAIMMLHTETRCLIGYGCMGEKLTKVGPKLYPRTPNSLLRLPKKKSTQHNGRRRNSRNIGHPVRYSDEDI